MFPFWEVAIAPVLEAAGARRIVEIGALRGENTRQMIDRLGPRTELHVIDPVPDFDPEEHAKQFGGQYVFHRDLSLNVLGDLPAMDAALIDGDHNWYTVYNECRLLAASAARDGQPLPVMILHDVGWPYGRRDLYYDPSSIPDEHRRDWDRKGMEPGKVRLVPYGAGLNPTLANARVEGGRHNGVMTGLEDWMAEHPEPLRRVVLPIYFGLAIVVAEERLARQPALAAVLDGLESPAGKDALLDLSESIRLDHLIFQHKIFYDRQTTVERLAGRYLREVRRGVAGDEPDPDRLEDLETALERVRTEYGRGHLLVAGVAPAASAVTCRAHATAHERRQGSLWVLVADDGSGVDDETKSVHHELERFDLSDERVHVVSASEAPSLDTGALSLIHLGHDLGAGAAPLVEALHHHLAPGGLVLADAGLAEEHRAAVAAALTRLDPQATVSLLPGGATVWSRSGQPT